MATWTTNEIPDQTGRTVLITGANSGLGRYSAHALAQRGARVLMACRDTGRGQAALDEVAADAATPPELVELDLSDLSSVREAAEQIRKRTGDELDVLMNNAGVMATPRRQTRDGFELQIGTNHLGHAALTWLLMPALRDRPGARVVTLSSIAHRRGHVDVDDLNFQRRHYRPMRSYSQSKLANLLFMLELDHRARELDWDLTSVAAHPGMSNTELLTNTTRSRALPAFADRAVGAAGRLLTQSTAQGALPQLYAATAADVTGGEYFGPDGPGEIRGNPRRAALSRNARHSRRTAERLWEETAKLTGIIPEPG